MATQQHREATVGVVVIGRNEGERLRRCLAALAGLHSAVVYVDSASSDGSVAAARARGAEVVELDMSTPFTAARARNAGFTRLRELQPQISFVQFIDGDCEVIDGWLAAASSFLSVRTEVACVCGRLRERFPERSIYNRLCDREWSRPVGATEACGGIAMMRADLFAAAGGFREDLVAGEEPELCERLRQRGFTIWRLSEPMAFHDADMRRFGQWWMRSRRGGFGYAQAAWLLGRSGGSTHLRRLLRPWWWAVAVPLATLAALALGGWPALLLLLAYPLGILRIASSERGRWPWRITYASFLMLGKLPEWIGECEFWLGHSRGTASSVSFDYKR